MKLSKYMLIPVVLALAYYACGGGCSSSHNYPKVRITSPGYSSHVVTIRYALYDFWGDDAKIHVFYTTNGEDFHNCTISPTATEGTENLRCTPPGIDHVFLWDSFADLKQKTIYNNVQIKIIPFLKDRGRERITETFIIDNRENQKPSCGIEISESDPNDWFDNWDISPGLDFDVDTSDGFIYYSYTVGPGAVKTGVMNFYRDSSLTELIATGSADFEENATILTFSPYESSTFAGSVQVDLKFPPSIFYYDFRGTDWGYVLPNWAFSYDIDFGDLDTITTPGNATLFFNYDFDNTNGVAILSFYQDSNRSLLLASGSGPTGGYVHVDGSYSVSGDVYVENTSTTSFDNGAIIFYVHASTTGYIQMESSIVPAPIAAMSGNGTFVVTYYLVDMDNDSVDVEIKFTVDDCLPITATEAEGSLSHGIEGLEANDRGTAEHTFLWDSRKDIGYGPDAYQTNVKISITPKDPEGSGTTGWTVAFTVDNRP